MTSAPNLRQPSNGNNNLRFKFLCAALLLLGIISCETLGRGQQRKAPGLDKVTVTGNEHKPTITEQPKTPPAKPKVPVVAQNDTTFRIDSIIDGNIMRIVRYAQVNGMVVSMDILREVAIAEPESPGGILLKDSYNVAVFLPFRTDLYAEGSDIPRDARSAIQYYEGMLMAMNDLQSEGLSLNVHVYDTQRDADTLRQLLAIDEVQDADLLIGPIFSGTAKVLADFAKAKRIPLYSPVNPNEDIANENPYYLQVSPSFSTHAKQTVAYIKKKYGKRLNAVIVCRKDSIELAYAEQYQRAHFAIEGSTGVPPIKQCIIDTKTFSEAQLQPYLSPTDSNIILIPSWQDKDFNRSVFRGLLNVNPYRYRLAVFGVEEWLEFDNIDFKDFDRLNFHFTSDFYVDGSSNVVTAFKKRYFNNYGMPPTRYVFMGYGDMKYIGDMLSEYGLSLRGNLEKSPGQSIHTQYAFLPIFSEGKGLDGSAPTYAKTLRMENSFVNVILFQYMKYRKMN